VCVEARLERAVAVVVHGEAGDGHQLGQFTLAPAQPFESM
jgi:hypothetical protein